MAHMDPDRGACGILLKRRAACLLLALASLPACGRKGDLYLPEGRTPAPAAEDGAELPDRTEETDNRGER
jgi:predicted small lipoprotein YifL